MSIDDIIIIDQEEFEEFYNEQIEDTRHSFNHIAGFYNEYIRYKTDDRFKIVYFRNGSDYLYEVIPSGQVMDETDIQRRINNMLRIKRDEK